MFDFPCAGESHDNQQTRKWCGRESLGNKRNETRPAEREGLQPNDLAEAGETQGEIMQM